MSISLHEVSDPTRAASIANRQVLILPKIEPGMREFRIPQDLDDGLPEADFTLGELHDGLLNFLDGSTG